MPHRKRRKLLWQLFPTYVFVVAISLAASAWYGARTFESAYMASLGRNLEARARVVGRALENLQTLDAASADAVCKSYGELTATRITAILLDGTVVGDSEKNPAEMENHGLRDEFLQAVKNGAGSAVRDSASVHREMMYVAIYHDGAAGGPDFVVRTAISLSEVKAAMGKVYSRVFLFGLTILVLSAAISVYLTRRTTRQIDALTESAERYADGKLDREIETSEHASEELAVLSNALSRMASELKRRIDTSERERAELSAVLSAMVEGVIAVDREGKIITINPAASALAETGGKPAIGRTIFEVARHAEFQRFITEALKTGMAAEKEITLTKDSDRIIKITGTPLPGGAGALFVMDDVTRLRKLENVRREFVANVSHELKTPITSIKGFVETLLDGAMDDEEAKVKFLEIIKKQSDRLQAIIEDLLQLARVEQAAEESALELGEISLRQVAAAAIDGCFARAAKTRPEAVLECPGDIRVLANGALLELAIVNLIDNAIKYGGGGGKVTVSCKKEGACAVVSVADEGPGIPKEHLGRLFERFYRVDRARSRDVGGTGLGLAIVKHIALAHGGAVFVESEPGKGSVFSIRIRLADLSE